jgi:mannose-6-phosphate isomerase
MFSKPELTKKPWGKEELFALCGKYAGKIITVKKGCRLSLQFHKKKEETFYLSKGKLKITWGISLSKLKNKIIKTGQTFHIPPKTIHRTEALKDCVIIEVSTPELSDIVRIEDDYNRIKKER